MSRRFNTPLWSGLILALIGIFSYIFVFVRWPITRDVPWVSFLIFIIALALLVMGFRRAERKIMPSIVRARERFLAAVAGACTGRLPRFLGPYGRSWAVPGSETAPGPGRSPAASTVALKVGWMQKALTSVEAWPAPSVMLPAGAPVSVIV